MTIEELWDKIQIQMNIMEKGLREEMSTMESGLREEMNTKEKSLKDEIKEMKDDIHMMKDDINDIKNEVHVIKGDIHIIKDVNLPHILTHQEETRKELKDKIEGYIQKHDVEHKKIDYQLANLEWNNKIAN